MSAALITTLLLTSVVRANDVKGIAYMIDGKLDTLKIVMLSIFCLQVIFLFVRLWQIRKVTKETKYRLVIQKQMFY